ncbi:MAG: BMP family ABC transporter substrate-binding protein, partial [Rickettsiales bacterium]|nr:BMP family ABC transporter substrate-binding protein [Rickettsiales bacterium]
MKPRLALLALLLYFTYPAHAHDEPQVQGENGIRPAVVVYFNDGSERSHEHADMVSRMVHELKDTSPMPVRELVLPSERELSAQIEKLAEDDIGLLVIIEPRASEALAKIPSLYPDVNFTIIGANVPLYFTNVRAMHFRDQEGTFMMGALAALRTQKGTIAYISSADTATSRNLAYGFLQGAKQANPEIKVVQLLGAKPEGP